MDLYEIRIALNAGKSIYDLPLRVTYYARVSTDKDEQIHSLSALLPQYPGQYSIYPGAAKEWGRGAVPIG